MPFDYYYAKRANLSLLDEQIRALAFAAGRGYAGSEWLDPSITPVPGESLVLHWGRALTSTQETQVGDIVVAHDAVELTAEQEAGQAKAAADTAELARIQELGASARAVPPTITPAQETELLGLLERRLYG